MLPTISSGNVASALPSGYDVANSVRYNPTDTPKLYKAATSSTSVQKATISCWVKRTELGTNQYVWFSGFTADTGSYNFYVRFSSDDTLKIINDDAGTNLNYVTNRKFKDVSAFYHIVVKLDLSESGNDRCKLYINGAQETSFSTQTAMSGDQFLVGKNNYTQWVGHSNNATSENFNGYISEFCYIDADDLLPTSFGEYDSDTPSIWKPKDVSGLTFGTNGFYLDFEDSSNLGNDANGGTDLTVSGLASTDQCTDTPTNNFSIINANDNYWAGATITEGGTKVVTGSSNEAMSTSTFAMTRGKWYFEVDNMSGAGARICGITPTVSFSGGGHGKAGDVTPHTVSYIAGGAVQEGDGSGGQSTLATYASYANGDIIGVYMDLDNMKAYLSKNGTLQSSTGIDLEPLATNGTGYYMFFVGDNNTGSRTVEANFGNPFQAQTSSVADDNGYGKFEYSPNITGDGSAKSFYSCCAKNLAEFG